MFDPLPKNSADEVAAYVVLAVLFLNVLEISRVIDHIHPEERNRHLIGRSMSLVERALDCTASSTVGLELLRIAFESLSFRSGDPFRVRRG